jgi:hypothetical protein
MHINKARKAYRGMKEEVDFRFPTTHSWVFWFKFYILQQGLEDGWKSHDTLSMEEALVVEMGNQIKKSTIN